MGKTEDRGKYIREKLEETEKRNPREDKGMKRKDKIRQRREEENTQDPIESTAEADKQEKKSEKRG